MGDVKGKKERPSAWKQRILRERNSRKPRTRTSKRKTIRPIELLSSKFNPKKAKVIIAMLRRGNPPETVAAAVGLTSSILKKWMGDGARILDNAVDQDVSHMSREDRELAQFALDVQAALSKFTDEQLKYIRRARGTWWQSAAWMLERRLPDQFARTQKMKAEGEMRRAPVIDAKVLIATSEGVEAVGQLFRTLAESQQPQRLGPGEDRTGRLGEVREPAQLAVREASPPAEPVPAGSRSGADQPTHRGDAPTPRQE